MTNSMTAFGQATFDGESGNYTCEIRTVNHRFLEVHLRLPEEIRALENIVRERIAGQLSRGRVDCFIKKSEASTALAATAVDDNVVQHLEQLANSVRQTTSSVEPLRMIDVLRWPGALVTPTIDADTQRDDITQVVEEALAKVKTTRAVEGAKLAGLITQRLTEVNTIVSDVEDLMPQINQQYRERLQDKLLAVKEDMDESRLEQEMVIYLQKSDVAEELDRLNVHTTEVADTLQQNKPVGRRLDFLMQELNREANTLGSKSQYAQLTQCGVQLKVLIEQMREQVQNIE